jgi:N-methylhydantoinase B
MTTAEEASRWNWAVEGYIPPDRIETEIPFHTDAKSTDPISYELIRHALWNINTEHGQTIAKVSGSPFAIYVHDLNPAITDELGELVYGGQFIQHMCAGAPSAVQWILEYRSENPGIAEGDVFLTNDPWIGVNHQQDILLLKPVFVDGAIFSWISSTLHQYDMGGTTPSSFCPDARDAFWEPSPIPPMKFVSGGAILADVEEMVVRKSRLSELVRLDLRAMIAGVNVAEQRMRELCSRYGPEVLKGVMRKISDDSEQVFVSRLEAIPDGIWRDRSYLEMSLPGDPGVYKVELTMTKEGDRLTFGNSGTDPQVGAINSTIISFKGCIMTALIGALLHDQLFAHGGPMRHITFDPEPGTLTCARHPAAVTAGTATAMSLVLCQAQTVVSKMVACSANEWDRGEATAKPGASQYPILSQGGTSQWGTPFATIALEPIMSGVGGFMNRDGVSTGGYPFDPKATAPNVEHSEQSFPLLTLYRRELIDSGGPGRYRGGASAVCATVPHGVDEIELATAASGVWQPTGTGIFGGGAALPSRFWLKRGTDIADKLAGGDVPTDLSELSGIDEFLDPKQAGILQQTGDVLEMEYCAAGGFGDPFERDPQLVATDVELGIVSAHAASLNYGVAVRVSGESAEVDEEGTRHLRDQELKRRREQSAPSEQLRVPTQPESRNGRVTIADTIAIEFKDGTSLYRCQGCGEEIGRNVRSYKSCTRFSDRELDDVLAKPVLGVSGEATKIVQREHYCPVCYRRVDAEILMPGDPSLVDIEISSAPHIDA